MYGPIVLILFRKSDNYKVLKITTNYQPSRDIFSRSATFQTQRMFVIIKIRERFRIKIDGRFYNGYEYRCGNKKAASRAGNDSVTRLLISLTSWWRKATMAIIIGCWQILTYILPSLILKVTIL